MAGVYSSDRNTMTVATWAEFKTYLDGTAASGAFTFSENADFYRIITEPLAGIRLEHTLRKDGGADQIDFDTNFKNNPLVVKSGISYDGGLTEWLGSQAPTVGQKAMAASLPVTLASDQPAINITGTVVANIPASAADLATISVGMVTTSAAGTALQTTGTLVMLTTYTEQNAAARRSIASNNAADTAAGTGARTVRLTYFDGSMAGPFTEDLTLNGTTPVPTVNTNIRYVESLRVLTTGSGGQNAGILTLFVNNAGGGGTIGTARAGDNQTFWCHHYVPTGKVCSVTSMTVGTNSTSSTAGGFFFLKARKMDGVIAPMTTGTVVTDFVRSYGQSSTTQRVYDNSIRVTGPAHIVVHAVAEAATSTTHRASFDFYERVP